MTIKRQQYNRIGQVCVQERGCVCLREWGGERVCGGEWMIERLRLYVHGCVVELTVYIGDP